MSVKTYLNLLILCVVLYQGIIGTLSEDIDESSELLIRQKRVINRTPGEDQKVLIKDVPYIVIIKPRRTFNYCAGSILTNYIVITVAKCVQEDLRLYRVYAGTARQTLSGRYSVHEIREKRVHIGSHPYRMADGIALVVVDKPFIYSLNTRSIEFYEGHVQPGTLATVSGWGCADEDDDQGTEHPEYLRSITVPIIDRLTCAHMYHRKFAIGESDVCTLDPLGSQFCGNQDAGAPLVVKHQFVNKLIGIHLWNGGIVGQKNPDVFVNLQYPVYKTWIRETIIDIEKHLYNRDHGHLPHNVQHAQSSSSPHLHRSPNTQ